MGYIKFIKCDIVKLKQFSGVLKGSERLRYTEVWRGQRVGSTNGWVDIKQDAKDGIRTCQKEPELYHTKPVNELSRLL
uniref:Uncharacterized protein n=1 Tax=Candidatus Methanophagaceae archaeon ANME-1 ERB6 TaxID=2759912 RepID=A0A7G9YZN7_9EURY|nr:hypothetical protein HCHKDHBN_00042 [Methanosarcinales archaeon ANME-1 ERB6]